MRMFQIISVFAVFFISVLKVQAGPASLGVIVGTQNGLSFKYNLSENRAIDAAITNTFNNDYGTTFHADYLVDRARVFNLGRGTPASLYYGVGLRASNIKKGSDDGKTFVAVRVPIGIQHSMVNPNLDFFGELAPALALTPSSGVTIDVGLGLRYRF